MSKATVNFAAVPRVPTDVISRRDTAGNITIMRLDDEEDFFTLDGIAAEMWTLVDGKQSLESIREKLIKKFTPPESLFDRDLTKMLGELAQEKLILLDK